MFETIKNFGTWLALDLPHDPQVYLATGLALAILMALYFKLHPSRLITYDDEPSEGLWMVPTPVMLWHQRRSIKTYPEAYLREIYPMSTADIVRVALFMRQSVSYGEITERRRLATVSALYYGFAVPGEMVVLDDETASLYCEFRYLLRPRHVSVPLMESSYGREYTPMQAERMQFLLSTFFIVLGRFLEDAKNKHCLIFSRFAQPFQETYGLTQEELRAQISAYGAFTQATIPADYVLESGLTWLIYQQLSSAQLYQPGGWWMAARKIMENNS